MKPEYRRLVALAEEKDHPASLDTVAELISLLERLTPGQVMEEHVRLLDDLITVMWNTENIEPAHADRILQLQQELRVRIYDGG
ncbi:hypothetical protein [Luteimonas sp. A501]